MTPQIYEWMIDTRKNITFNPGRVLEIGSQNINGSIRDLFEDADEYVGIDMVEGPGVDLVLNASKSLQHFGQLSFDTIICCETLEHDLYFYDTVEQIYQMLRLGGFLIITTPTFGFPLHRHPKDYWRFGEDAYREVFFSGMLVLDLQFLNDAAGPKITIAAIGQK